MSTTLSHTSSYVYELVKSSSAKLSTLFISFTDFFYHASSAHKCSIEVERLMALSDVELAKVGVKREDIASYAFRRYMHI